MTIRVSRNEEGNCVTFVGASNPAYWNSCLSAVINSDDPTRFNIVNDIRSSNSDDIQYEFYAVEFADFADKDGNVFTSAQEAVDYINANANVLGVSDTGIDLNGIDVNFRLDDTNTSIIMDNGSAFGVNTIQAVANADGTVHLHAVSPSKPNAGDEANDKKHFEGLEVGRVSVNGTVVAGGLQDVTNTLNELFTVGAFESIVISDPFSTMVADVDGVDTVGGLVGDAIDPTGADIGAGLSAHYNKAGYLSTDTIDQAGEYFTFDIRNESIIGLGLVLDDVADVNGNATYGDPAAFCNGVTNSGHYGYQFGHFFHPSPNGPWTNYGANTGLVYGTGWNGSNRFNNSPEGADWLAGNNVKIKVGLDEQGFIAISYYDVSEQAFVVCVRTSYPVAEGVKFRLGIKFCDSLGRLVTTPKTHLLEPAAPTMQFRYIESPDGVFHYPLFATAEEANYYDEIHNGLTAGTGSSHTHTYVDDATNTTWYMPEASHDAASYTHSVVPPATTFSGNAVTYTEVTSLTNADLTPTAFSGSDITQQEGTNVNIPVTPAGATWNSSVSITPSGSGLVYDGYSLVQGTLADVGSDTVYTVTVTRANSYGSTTGSMTVTATDVAPVSTNDTPWTKALDFSGSNQHLKQVSSSMYYQPIQMNGLASTVTLGTRSQGQTSDLSTSRPWATAIVFNSDGNNSNQIIWNQGEGSSTGSDNIYLRLSAVGSLMFGWGREGTGYNECRLANQSISSSNWYGVYIAHSGERLSGNNASAANLADCFDIRLMSSADSFASLSSNLSVTANWTSSGNRMDRTVAGDFTIGGRGNNSNFHGKIASMVVTTLLGGGSVGSTSTNMPDETQAKTMITDPIKWCDEYKERYGAYNGSGVFRKPAERFAVQPFLLNQNGAHQGTQIWLMGDGASDSYSNGLRNYVYPADQNNAKLQLNSMVSNDIETVNINGLT